MLWPALRFLSCPPSCTYYEFSPCRPSLPQPDTHHIISQHTISSSYDITVNRSNKACIGTCIASAQQMQTTQERIWCFTRWHANVPVAADLGGKAVSACVYRPQPFSPFTLVIVIVWRLAALCPCVLLPCPCYYSEYYALHIHDTTLNTILNCNTLLPYNIVSFQTTPCFARLPDATLRYTAPHCYIRHCTKLY